MKNFQLTIFGISGALPANGRHPSAQALQVGSGTYLIDCGEGTQMQMARYGFNSSPISAIFISHLHGDHYFGLAGLLTSWGLNRRTKPIHIFSPPGLEAILELQLLWKTYPPPYEYTFHEITPGQEACIYQDDFVEVFSIQLEHRISTSGYLFRERKRPKNIRKAKITEYDLTIEQIKQVKAGDDITLSNGQLIPNTELTFPERKQRTFAYCSDSRPVVHLDDRLKEVDLIYHDVTFAQAEQQKAIETGHSTTIEAAQVAKELNASRLIAGHFSARYGDLNPLLEEMQSVFKGAILGEEGGQYEVEWDELTAEKR